MLEPTFRPLITIIRLTPDRSFVEVSLDMDGRLATGFGDIVEDDSMAAACRGTIDAVQRLLPPALKLELDWCHRVALGHQDDVINSAVTLTTNADRSHQEHLIGAAYVRHDPDIAAVRATLDGLTRRLAIYLFP
ncbi:MAG TPA: hypothetical protein VMM13_15930 [Euzebya sp.]|nr:hypothetical protein [Euzebya sp.]